MTGGKKKFTIRDVYSDGICCGYGEGHYKVIENGNVLYEGGEFTDEAVHEWGSCDAPNPTTPPPTVPPTDAPTKAPTKAPTIAPTKNPTVPPTDAPTKAPTKAPTVAPTKNPTAPPVNPPPGAGVIDIDLFTLRFSFAPIDACYDTSLGGPTGASPGQCAQACAFMGSCAGFQTNSEGCVLASASPEPCPNPDAVFYERSAVMHFDD